MLTSYTKSFVNAVGITRGTNWSSYTQLYLAFSLSGAFHALSQRQMPRPVDVSDGDVVVGFFLFFLWQALAITFEDFAQYCWRGCLKRCGIDDSRLVARIVGYVWVTSCIWTSLPLAGDTFLRLRMGEDHMLPFDLTGSLVSRVIPIPS